MLSSKHRFRACSFNLHPHNAYDTITELANLVIIHLISERVVITDMPMRVRELMKEYYDEYIYDDDFFGNICLMLLSTATLGLLVLLSTDWCM